MSLASLMWEVSFGSRSTFLGFGVEVDLNSSGGLSLDSGIGVVSVMGRFILYRVWFQSLV